MSYVFVHLSLFGFFILQFYINCGIAPFLQMQIKAFLSVTVKISNISGSSTE